MSRNFNLLALNIKKAYFQKITAVLKLWMQAELGN